jgi:hypothetical protein
MRVPGSGVGLAIEGVDKVLSSFLRGIVMLHDKEQVYFSKEMAGLAMVGLGEGVRD